MSGCYSSSDIDRWLEEQADKYYNKVEEEEEIEENENDNRRN
jgi:hypothetical protein